MSYEDFIDLIDEIDSIHVLSLPNVDCPELGQSTESTSLPGHNEQGSSDDLVLL